MFLNAMKGENVHIFLHEMGMVLSSTQNSGLACCGVN